MSREPVQPKRPPSEDSAQSRPVRHDDGNGRHHQWRTVITTAVITAVIAALIGVAQEALVIREQVQTVVRDQQFLGTIILENRDRSATNAQNIIKLRIRMDEYIGCIRERCRSASGSTVLQYP